MESIDVALERRVDRALRRLPMPRAPQSLAPRVLHAIAAASQTVAAVGAGWRRWPIGWQLVALAAACWIAAAVVLGVPLAAQWIGQTPAAHAAVVLWRTVLAPITAPAIAIVAAMLTATALLVAALKHVAWEGRWTVHS